MIGVAGSVAVGKSTIARLLRELLARWDGHPAGRARSRPTGSCSRTPSSSGAGIMERKGFPESYDRRALLRFVSEVKSGRRRGARAVLLAPDLRHRAGRRDRRAPPDVLIVEGLNVLQPAGPGHRLAVSDLFDFTVYVDARTADIAALVRGALPGAAARRVHQPEVVLPPLRGAHRGRGAREGHGQLARDQRAEPAQNIRPTRARASLVLRKDADHAVSRSCSARSDASPLAAAERTAGAASGGGF